VAGTPVEGRYGGWVGGLLRCGVEKLWLGVSRLRGGVGIRREMPDTTGDDDAQGLLDASLALARTQLVGQLTDETSLDGRTMGTLGFNGALLAADIAARGLLGACWWAPLIAVGLATLCCLRPALAIGPDFARGTDFGPHAEGFYRSYAGKPLIVAQEQLLDDLDTAFLNNALRFAAKQRALRAALIILTAGLIAVALLIGLA
jgi:hypothetical protein